MMVADLFANLRLNTDGASFGKGNALISGVKGALAGIVAFFAVDKIEEGVKSVVDLGSELNDTAQKTGIAVEGLQELGYVAKLNSSDMESMASGVKKLSRGLDEAAQKGSGPAAGALTRLGLSMQDATFKALPLDAKVQLISEKLAKLPDGTEKTALSMDLFGKSGADLIPTLNDLGKNGDKLRQEFRDMGGEIDGKTAGALDDLGDNLDRAKFQLGALKTQVVVAVLPTLAKMVDGLLVWVKANKQVIAGGIRTFVDGLVIAFKAVATAVGFVIDAIQVVSDLFHAAFDGDTGAQAAVAGLAAVAAALLLPVLLSIAATMISIAASVVIAIAPFVLIAAVVAGVAFGVLQLVKHWDKVKTAIGRVWDAIKGVGRGMYNFFASIGNAISGAIHAAIDWIVSKIQWLEGKVSNLINRVKNLPGDAWDSVKNVASDAAGGIANIVSPNAGNTNNGGDTNVTNNVTVNAPNADAKQVGSAVATAIDDHWKAQMRGAKAGTGGSDQ